MALTLFFSLLFFLGIGGIVYLAVCTLRAGRISPLRAGCLALCAICTVAAWVYFRPVALRGYDAAITAQEVSWHAVSDSDAQPTCLQPEALPQQLKIRRYRLGDTPMPNHSAGTRTVQLDLTLADGKQCVLWLRPDSPASSQIQFYEAPYQGVTWFLCADCAKQCLELFLPEQSFPTKIP